MTLSQLRTFLAVAETGSVRAAAERLVVSQPSVSAAVAALERDLGVALVARQGRGLRITSAGAAFASGVRASLGLLEQTTRRARSIDDPSHGTARVVAVTTVAERLLLPLIAEFRRDNPAAGVTLHVGNRTTVWEALRDHEADLVVAGRPVSAAPARILARADNRLVVIGPASVERRPPRGHVTELLGSQPWLLREEGSGTRDAADALLAELGIHPPTMILGSNGAIEQAVAVGLGLALISRDAVASSIADGSIKVWACPGTPLDRPWHLVSHASEPLSPTALALARSMAAGRAGFRPTAEGRRLLCA